jgi:hypothetical protein
VIVIGKPILAVVVLVVLVLVPETKTFHVVLRDDSGRYVCTTVQGIFYKGKVLEARHGGNEGME